MSKADTVREMYEQSLEEMIYLNSFIDAATLMHDKLNLLAKKSELAGNKGVAEVFRDYAKRLSYAISPPEIYVWTYTHRHGLDVKLFVKQDQGPLPSAEQLADNFEEDEMAAFDGPWTLHQLPILTEYTGEQTKVQRVVLYEDGRSAIFCCSTGAFRYVSQPLAEAFLKARGYKRVNESEGYTTYFLNERGGR